MLTDCQRFSADVAHAREQFARFLDRAVGHGAMRDGLAQHFADGIRASYMLGIADMREARDADERIAQRATLTY